MKKICLDLSECNGIGDLICATPVIFKLEQSYERKVTILSQYPEIFKNHPSVEKSYKTSSVNYQYFKDNYLIHNSFYNVGKKNERGIEFKHNRIDIRQFHAINLGFMLLPEEMQCFYLPTEECSLPLPEKYFVIHPVQNWASRTWAEENWVRLIDALIEMDYEVVAIGKDSSETGFFNVSKPIQELHTDKFIDYLNKTSISDAWHIIQKSSGVVTMDSGILHLASTTMADIYHLGSSIHPDFRVAHRDFGVGNYAHIQGRCTKFCASDMKYGVREWGSIQGVPPLIGCLEKYPTFECHPSCDSVIEMISHILSKK